ncbi:MAG TPA: hypothetical protein VKG86_04510, partial [Terracidiphilus sp.]|nr:hypothetical protein [Terracidiphilus sp.]
MTVFVAQQPGMFTSGGTGAGSGGVERGGHHNTDENQGNQEFKHCFVSVCSSLPQLWRNQYTSKSSAGFKKTENTTKTSFGESECYGPSTLVVFKEVSRRRNEGTACDAG